MQPLIRSTLQQITLEARHGEALGLRMMRINVSSVMMPMLFGTVGAGARAAWGLKLTT